MSILTVLLIVLLALVLWSVIPRGPGAPYAFPSWAGFIVLLLVVLLLLDVLGVVNLRGA